MYISVVYIKLTLRIEKRIPISLQKDSIVSGHVMLVHLPEKPYTHESFHFQRKTRRHTRLIVLLDLHTDKLRRVALKYLQRTRKQC